MIKPDMTNDRHFFICYDITMNKYKTVEEFMNDLDEKRLAEVQKLRQYILEAPALKEHIKWNAPSYMKDDEDRITFNTMNKDQVVKLVLHMGASRKEDRKAEPILKNATLVEWVSDIRGYMTFNSLDEITSNEKEIMRTVREWLALT